MTRSAFNLPVTQTFFCLGCAVFLFFIPLRFSDVTANAGDSLIPLEMPEGNLALVGAGFYPDYFGSDDFLFGALPVVRYQLGNNRHVSLIGNELKLNMIDDKHWRSGPMGLYRFSREGTKDPAVDRMEPLEGAVELGGFLNYVIMDEDDFRKSMGIGAWSMFDITGTHDGYVYGMSMHGSYPVLMPLTLMAGMGVTWTDSRYMNTYFGVNPGDSASSGLPVYTPGSGLRDVRGWLIAILHLGVQWHTGIGIIYSGLQDEPSGSPIVKDRGSPDQWVYGAGFAYIW